MSLPSGPRIRDRVVATSDLSATHYQRNDEQDEEDQEQDLRDAGGSTGNAGKTENAGDQGDDQEYDGVVQHGRLLGWRRIDDEDAWLRRSQGEIDAEAVNAL